MAETPRFAHLTILFFLGSAFLVVSSVVAAMIAKIARAKTFAKFAAVVAGMIPVGYAVVLLGVGAVTRGQTLPAGGWKYFCEADCHIAYQVDSMQEAATLGAAAAPVTARGRFVVVGLKTWFDEKTIAPFRGNGALWPNPRAVSLLDDVGHRYTPLRDVPGGVGQESTPLSTPLRPGQSYVTVLIFDVPREAANLKLLVSDSDPVSHLLVDHENSPLHGKIFLAL